MLDMLRDIAGHKHQVTLVQDKLVQDELNIRVSKMGAIVVVFNHYKCIKTFIRVDSIESVIIDHVEHRPGAMRLNDVYHATIILK